MKLYPDKTLLYTASFFASVVGIASTLFLLSLGFADARIETWDIIGWINIFWPFVGGLLAASHFLSTSRKILDIGNENIRIREGIINIEIPTRKAMLGRNVMLVGNALIHLRIGDRWICYKDENNRPMRLENIESTGISKQSGLIISAQLLKQGSVLAMLFLIWALVGTCLFIRAAFFA